MPQINTDSDEEAGLCGESYDTSRKQKIIGAQGKVSIRRIPSETKFDYGTIPMDFSEGDQSNTENRPEVSTSKRSSNRNKIISSIGSMWINSLRRLQNSESQMCSECKNSVDDCHCADDSRT